MNNQRLTQLFERYHNGTATDIEVSELMEMIENVTDDELFALLKHTWNQLDGRQAFFSPDLQEMLFSKINPGEAYTGKVYPINKKRMLVFRIAAAAAIILVLSTTALLLVRKNENDVATTQNSIPVSNEIVPGGDKAILTLGDGKQIILDNAANGALTKQGGVKVIKIGGQLAYNAETKTSEILYNTITTPKGGQYQLELADGSKVWLNASSSLHFPTAFVGKDRTVELTGEGYFEVAHNAEKPFHVKVNDMDVQVLGTHFNINSYGDEPSIKTTLLEGRVQVSKGEKNVFLNPGQQAIVRQGQTDIRVNHSVDVEEVVAWKNGRFYFNSADIQTIMRQIQRWYDVEVSYPNGIPEGRYRGKPSRNVNASQVLNILEEAGLNFKIEGKKINVMQ